MLYFPIFSIIYCSKLRNPLEYKASCGFEMFVTNKLCSDCGYQNKYIKSLKLCAWKCFSGDTHHDWDINTGVNFRNEAIYLLTV